MYIPSPANGQVLTYSSVLQKWTTGSPASASGQTGYYGSFYDTTAQTLTGVNQAKRLDIADTFEANGVSLSSNKIVFNNIGTYEIIFSIQYKNTSSTQEDIYVWFRKNGVDVPDSSSVFTIPQRKNENIPAQLIAVTPFIATLAANDFIEIYWHCGNTAVTVETFTTHANPTIPDTPGVIITVKQVTNVQLVPTVGAYLPLSGGTVTGVLSTTNVIYASGGNSNQWNSTYTTVQSNSTVWSAGSETAIGITIDGAGSAITTGDKGSISIPYNAILNNVTMIADVSGVCVIDILKSNFSTYPTSSSICSTSKPTISGAIKSIDSTLSSWTTNIQNGDILDFQVLSASGITKLNLTIGATKY